MDDKFIHSLELLIHPLTWTHSFKDKGALPEIKLLLFKRLVRIAEHTLGLPEILIASNSISKGAANAVSSRHAGGFGDFGIPGIRFGAFSMTPVRLITELRV